jgi:type II secretory pathway component PulM
VPATLVEQTAALVSGARAQGAQPVQEPAEIEQLARHSLERFGYV